MSGCRAAFNIFVLSSAPKPSPVELQRLRWRRHVDGGSTVTKRLPGMCFADLEDVGCSEVFGLSMATPLSSPFQSLNFAWD